MAEFEKYWAVRCKGFDFVTEVLALTRAKAIHMVMQKAKEAGYRPKWTDFTAHRIPG